MTQHNAAQSPKRSVLMFKRFGRCEVRVLVQWRYSLQHTSSFLLHLVAIFTLVIVGDFFPDFVLGISAFLTARMYHLITDILWCVISNILKSSQNLEVFIVRYPGGLPKGWGLF